MYLDTSKARGSRRGQTIIIFALSLVALVGLVGLGVDGGIQYNCRSELVKAVDAGCLELVRNVGKDDMITPTIRTVRANFSKAVIDTNDISVRIERDAQGRPIALYGEVQATAVQPCTFMRVLGFRDIPHRADCESVRFPICMGVIIDRSGSMTENGGSTTIPATIPNFLSNFVPGFDTVGIYSYSWTANRELAFTTNFQSQAMRDLFNGSANRIQFGGYTAPGDCLRMTLQDIEQLDAYEEKGVKKIIVFMTDGIFNTIRTRPPNVMGAFSNAPPGKTQAWWESNYLSTDDRYSSQSEAGNDGSGLEPLRSQSGPSYNFASYGGGVTFLRTNSTGGVLFRNLDVAIAENLSMSLPVIACTQTFVFAANEGGVYTNRYIVRGKTSAASGYPEGVDIVLDSATAGTGQTKLSAVNPLFKYRNNTVSGSGAVDYFKNNFRFVSAIDGSYKKFTSSSIQAEAREFAKRYCKVARKQKTDPKRVTIYCIGFGNDSQLDVPLLMEMANLDDADRSVPYTPLDNDEPYDESFGFTLARNADELNRTYIALGIYLSTRLTR